MRRVVMVNIVTLEGFFEGPEKWALDWHLEAWREDDLEQFSLDLLHEAGSLLFGRVTYEGMAAAWSTATGPVADLMNALPKLVFSRSLQRVDWQNTRLVRGPAEEEVARLKLEAGRDLVVMGSADLSASLMRRDLIDEYRIALAPLILGAGTPLFQRQPERRRLRLIEAQPRESGVVVLRYEPVREG